MLRTTFCLALALGAFASPALARKAEPLRIQYADLDIATQEGQAELNARIDQAVRDFCDADVWVDGQGYFESIQCMKVAQARIEAQRQAAIDRAIKHRPVVTVVLGNTTPGSDNSADAVTLYASR